MLFRSDAGSDHADGVWGVQRVLFWRQAALEPLRCVRLSRGWGLLYVPQVLASSQGGGPPGVILVNSFIFIALRFWLPAKM